MSTKDKLDDISRAYQAAKRDDAQPATQIDDAIRAAARRAVQAKPASMAHQWMRRFGMPLSSAAVVMLTISVLYLNVVNTPQMLPVVNSPASHSETVDQAAAVAGQASEQSIADKRSAKLDSEQDAAKRERQTAAPSAIENDSEQRLRKMAVATAPLGERENKPRRVDETAAKSMPEKVANSSASSLRSPQISDSPTPPQAMAEPHFSPDPPVRAAEIVREQGLPLTVMQPEPRTEAAQSVSRSNDQAVRDRSEVSDSSPPEFSAAPPPIPAAAPPPHAEFEAIVVSGSRVKRLDTLSTVEDSDAWILRMQRLRKDKKHRLLLVEMREFRKAYPDAKLPTELQALSPR